MQKVYPLSIDDLIEATPYEPDGPDAARLRAAFDLATAVHQDKRRASGELYAMHDIAVAQIMAKMGADLDTIIAGMLHDVMMSGATLMTIADTFGTAVAAMVSSLNILRKYDREQKEPKEKKNESSKNTISPEEIMERKRKAIVSVIKDDIRAIVIRLADCVQDLRSIKGLPPDLQQEVAQEGLDIYAPLANRLGMWQLKWEIEDSAFHILQPEQYKLIADALAEKRDERDIKIKQAAARLKARLEESHLNCTVNGRPKHIYSIHRKMLRKDLKFGELYDIQALRIILHPDQSGYGEMSSYAVDNHERSLCYQALGIVHSLWQPIPREFDDYIASPKANGYKSLHTAVVDPANAQTLEIQIRTQRMHKEAEQGVAAHWQYKENDTFVSNELTRRIRTVRGVLSSLQNSDDSLDTEILAERIYVFTPNGDIIDLPQGATPIDFAYQIHTSIGHRCRGARVNGKMVSLDYQLQERDRVEIITHSRATPSRDWMNDKLGYTGSARTRSKIRQWFRNQERDQNVEQGREAVERELKRLGLQDSYTVEDIAKALHYDDVEQFLAQVGFGDVQSAQITGAIARLQNQLKPDDDIRPLLNPTKHKGLTVKGVGGVHTQIAKCCTPIPPEPITGYITQGRGISVHSKSCRELDNLKDTARRIDVSWGEEAERYPIPIVVESYRRGKLIDDILNIVRGQQIPVPKTKTVTKDNIVKIYMVAEVKDLDQLQWLLTKLGNLPHIISVARQGWK